jgi:sigma-B regulation protein RsbU (phosphoserine phosphatase)
MRRNINRRNQARLVGALNREFGELAKMNRFATAVVATYLTDDDTLTVSNAGHPPPLWRRAATGAWSVLKPDGPAFDALEDLPLGIVAEMAYTRHEIVLQPGDLFLIYTDALTEGESPDGVQLGEEGLLALIAALDTTDPTTVPDALVAALDAFRGGRAVDDDATFILIHHNAAPGRCPGFRENLTIYAKMLGLKSV